MAEFESLRQEIDQIHVEFAHLFRRRLQLTKKIWEIKKENGIALFDSKREQEIIHRFDQVVSDPQEQSAVQNLFRLLLSETKKYLEAKVK